MRLSISLALPLLLSGSGGGVAAFAPASRCQLSKAARTTSTTNKRHDQFQLSSLSDVDDDGPAPDKKKKVLTAAAADVMARSSSASGNNISGGGAVSSAPGGQDALKISTSEIYDHLQSSLLLLEKRAEDGIDSLTPDEVKWFDQEIDRILIEMKEYNLTDPEPDEGVEEGSAAYTDAVVDADTAGHVANGDIVDDSPVTPIATDEEPSSDDQQQPSDESVNFGLARGTTNTYAIPGMDEMSAEEYRDTLQDTSSARHRQAQRRKSSFSSNEGDIGNGGSNGYLSGLSGPGASSDGASAPVSKRKSFGRWKPGPAVENDDVSKYQARLEQSSELDAQADREESQKENALVQGTIDDGEKLQTQLPSEPVNVDEAPEKRSFPPMTKLMLSKLYQEQKQKTEWQEGLQREGGDKSDGTVQGSKSENKSGFKSILTDLDKLQASLDEKASPVSPTSVLSSRGNAQVGHRPKPTSAIGQDNFFNKISSSATSPDYTCEASQKVSTESTGSFAHGNDGGNSQRTFKTVGDRSRPGYFEVHKSASDERKARPQSKSSHAQSILHRGPGDTKSAPVPSDKSDHAQSIQASDHRGPGDMKNPSLTSPSSSEVKRSLVETEHQQRPVASTDEPDYIKMKDHRGVGDTRRKTSSTATTPSSLVDTEERVRPIPSSNMPEYAQVKDHRGVGDTKHHAPRRSQQKLQQSSYYGKSLVETEGRVRPIPSTDLPDYARVSDHRSTGDSKDPNSMQRSSSVSGTVSLIDTEERIRPTVSSYSPEDAQLKDRRSVGDMKDPSLRSQKPAQTKSLIETEERVRPVASSLNKREDYVTITDHRGPGDTHALTRRLTDPSSSVRASLSAAEQRVRPSPSSNQFQNFRAGDHRGPGDTNTLTNRSFDNRNNEVTITDHRGPGDTNSLTKRVTGSPASVASASSSEAETRVRPAPSSHQFQSSRVGDHRGPGDTNTLTMRSGPAFVAASLSGTEQSVRPTALSSNQLQNFQASDHRGVGDSRTLTKKVQSSTIMAAVSLSEEEERQRPVPTSGRSHQSQSFQVTDHRGVGDTRTLTRKLQLSSSLSSPSTVTSLSEEEQRQRPVPSFARQPKFAMLNDRAGSDNRRLTKNKKAHAADKASSLTAADEPISPGKEGQWWNEQTQRRPVYVSDLSKGSASVLNRGAVENNDKSSHSVASDDEPSSSLNPPKQPSLLKSLLNVDKKQRASSPGNTIDNPIAAMPPSSLQSLLNQDEQQGEPVAGIEENANAPQHRGRPNISSARPLSSLLKEDRNRGSESEGNSSRSPTRPNGYVRHFQPMKTSYVKKNEAPRDYGNVVIATISGEGDDAPSSGEEGRDEEE